jgi:ubiquinone biosynthesis protein UbiJ
MTQSESTQTRSPNPILGFFGRGLESALNRVLALDPDTQSALKALDGRALSIDFRGTGRAMRLTVDGERLVVGPDFAAQSDLRVSASPGSLLAMAAARLRGDAEATLPGKVEISGDAELARRLERLVHRFEPDVDEAFARVFGDVLGVKMAYALRGALSFARKSVSAVIQDSADYLVEESRDLVARAEMDQFLDDVDDARERADRLEARLRRLTTAKKA